MAAGSIVIDLLMRTGAFETDTDRAAKKLKQFEKQVKDVGTAIGTGIAVAITGAAVAFDQLVKSAADFKDFEETVGSSAEDIASLAVAAATAGVAMESVTGATIKLTKGLTGVDDESKAVGAALKALGINIEEFKQLDPVGQYEAVGKALNGFADGAQKTAVAVALFGKSGAEQLKVFKALEEQGGRQVILTQRQIDLADAYADAQAKQIATFKAYAQAAATDVLPALNDLTETAVELFRAFAGIDDAGKKLAGQSPVKEFADSAVKALAFVVDSGQGVVRVFQSIGTAIGGAAAAAVAAASGDFKAAKVIMSEMREDIDKILGAELFSQRLAKIQERNRGAALGSDPRELARRGRGPAASKPELAFDGAEKAAKATKDKTTEADRYIERLRDQVQKTQDLTEVEKVLDDITSGRFKNAKAFQASQALALADEIDRAKQLEASNKKQIEDAEKLEEVSKRLREETTRIFEDTRTPAEQYAAQLERLNYLLETGSLKTDVYARAVAQLQDKFDENVRRQKDLALDINQTLESSGLTFFDRIVDGSLRGSRAVREFASSVIKDLARIGQQRLAKELFGGGESGTGGLGGLLSGLLNNSSSGTGFGTGSNFGNQDYGAFLATGTNNIPYDGFRATLHKGEAVVPAKYNPAAGGGKASRIEVINPPGMPQTAQAREETDSNGDRLVKIVLSAVAQDIRSGGPVARAQESRYGARPQLTRRGR